MNKMANVLEKETFNYFPRLNEEEKKYVVQMLKLFFEWAPGKYGTNQY